MRYFQKMGENLLTLPLLHAVQRQPELWNANTLRTTYTATPHNEVEDIWLRFCDLEEYKGEDGEFNAELIKLVDKYENINYPAFHLLPQARPLIFGLMQLVEGERLGRVLITKMAPGTKISPHVDGGDHAAYYDRYHLVLQGLPGSLFRAGSEQVTMLTGELWWFDNSAEHEVVNNSTDDRVHLIVDIRTFR